MTELSDKILVAYVDGQLALKQSRAVEKVLEQDAVTAARAKALQEGHRRLEAAFDAILAGEVSEISALTAPIALTEERKRRGLAKFSLGVAGIVILLFAAAASYGWPPAISYRPVLRDVGPKPQPSAPASTEAAQAFEGNSDDAGMEEVERAGQDFVTAEERQVQASIAAADSQLGTSSAASITVAVPADEAAGLSATDRALLPVENLATPASDEATPNPAADVAERNSNAALQPKAGNDERVANEGQLAQDTANVSGSQSGPPDADSKLSDSEITGAVVADNNSEPDRISPLPAAPNPAGEAEHNSDAHPLRRVARDEALPQDGAGERVTGLPKDNDNAADPHPNPNNIGPDAKLSGAETVVGVPASDAHSAMLNQADRNLAAAQNPATPASDESTSNPAAEAANSNSVTLPKKVAGDETLHAKTGAGGLVPKEAKAEQPTEQLNAAHSQQPMALPATKSRKNEEASASAKKPLARQVKPAAPELRRGAKLKETASKSRSKPFALGTAGGLSPGKVSNRRASASDHATKVRQALGRHKPRSVGTSGSVTVSFAIGASGALRNARISRSSGKPQLDQAALATVRKAAPFPRPTRGGQPAYTITINFR
jgi:protein TonB